MNYKIRHNYSKHGFTDHILEEYINNALIVHCTIGNVERIMNENALYKNVLSRLISLLVNKNIIDIDQLKYIIENDSDLDLELIKDYSH